MKIQEIKAVAMGGKFCECGGLMLEDSRSGLLMSDPPQQKIHCPFCGNTDTVIAPYNVNIQFKKVSDEE